MSITFYPHEADMDASTLVQKLEVLTEAAERYKGIVLDQTSKTVEDARRALIPRDLTAVYNWEELAKILRQLRDLPENNRSNRLSKADHLMKLAEIYEVLRAAKMPKLEAVRLALVNEANQLRASTAA